MKPIIFNADIGEETGFDDEIMPYISWCNIACGAHAGGEEVINKTIDLAIHHNVKIGAHPSYPDRMNFGREVMQISYANLIDTITRQIQLVKKCTEEKGQKLHHVKPHGALYNEAMKNRLVGEAILESVKNIDKSLIIVTQKDSMISLLGGENFNIKHEAFADRNYNKDLSLVSRKENNAVITDPKKVFDHVFKMISEGKVKTKEGEKLSIFFDTICVHGDNPKSVEILRYIYNEFLERNFRVK
ncbi:5-oxoprolinase subunit PxpA [Aquimarina sp. 2201CG5-10]|uniref:5-oxoprolinase subunit PxpA n=1 Tax=Aquimarina callyspongiae TaxID=3098150 RepID=UPI002AB4C46A|nr:5-oxoprolinase subunit PxpA [Aquimarina sp. 2201CG5-10]MDY8138074.1 5-oxoprolinase subunit PxpA [Aquimarina sp. 2201CG5-10]